MCSFFNQLSLLICFTSEVEAINQGSKNIEIVGQPQYNVAHKGTTKTQSLKGKSPLSKSNANSFTKLTCITTGLNMKSRGVGELLSKVLSNKLVHDHVNNFEKTVTILKKLLNHFMCSLQKHNVEPLSVVEIANDTKTTKTKFGDDANVTTPPPPPPRTHAPRGV
jgi:hypothetical protein